MNLDLHRALRVKLFYPNPSANLVGIEERLMVAVKLHHGTPGCSFLLNSTVRKPLALGHSFDLKIY
jgi:hypothetical protein